MMDNGTAEAREHSELENLLAQAESNFTIYDSILKASSVIRRSFRPACSISGGSDSDIMLDICAKLDSERRIRYVWFDTGLEYQATKDHLKALEEKYEITIEREKPIRTIPSCCMEYGQPFLSKFVSDMIQRLQKHGFQWKDAPYEVLAERYPRAKGAISWWCNHCDATEYGYTQFNISYHRFLKDFMIANPPWFPISNKCCTYAKKAASKRYCKQNQIDLIIVGIRKAEGGIRASAYKNCFSRSADGTDMYRPLFWYTNRDKREYDAIFHVSHSDCYEKWGFDRTGCIGCPYGPHVLNELDVARAYEPKLTRAAEAVFKDAYQYTRMYREFCARRKSEVQKEKAPRCENAAESDCVATMPFQ